MLERGRGSAGRRRQSRNDECGKKKNKGSRKDGRVKYSSGKNKKQEERKRETEVGDGNIEVG